MQFQKGQSGNPAGRPRGLRDRRTIIAEQLLEADTEAIVKVLIERAKGGDMTAARLCVDRISPRVRERPAGFQLPALTTAADAAVAMAAIAQGLADGELAPAEAAELGKFVHAFAQTVTATDLEARIARLEEERELRGNLRRRIVALEAKAGDGKIPIFCSEQSQYEQRIAELMAIGVLTEADRPRCIFWLDHEGSRSKTHNDLMFEIALLEAENKRRNGPDPSSLSVPELRLTVGLDRHR
jgi:Family of unknown function (DUF5681)